MGTNITHITSAHPRDDIRIFLKMCSSLSRITNYSVSLIVADGKGDECKNNIRIYDVGIKGSGRLYRMTKTVSKVFDKAKLLDSDIYHLHDPELIPIGLKLKKIGKKIIFDSHEDVSKQILAKPYLSKGLLGLISIVYNLYENRSCKKFDFIIGATPFIRDKFLKINKNSMDINNFPILGEFSINDFSESVSQNAVIYIGSITRIRGIYEMVTAISICKTNVRLLLVGEFSEIDVKSEVINHHGWCRIDELGFLDRASIKTLLGKSLAGLVTLHPVINYLDALPIKMFEYMSAGIPVIASNFPLWMDIIENNHCGICVDPLNPKAIAVAIDYLVTNPEKAKEMGMNGKKAVNEKYNWEVEEKKLLSLYKIITM